MRSCYNTGARYCPVMVLSIVGILSSVDDVKVRARRAVTGARACAISPPRPLTYVRTYALTSRVTLFH